MTRADWVAVGRCRANCLLLFTDDATQLCADWEQCDECWTMCENAYEDYPPWYPVCEGELKDDYCVSMLSDRRRDGKGVKISEI